MARQPGNVPTTDIGKIVGEMEPAHVAALGQLSALSTSEPAFSHAFAANPAAALAAKGIVISAADATRIAQQIKQSGAANPGERVAKVEVGVTVGIG